MTSLVTRLYDCKGVMSSDQNVFGVSECSAFSRRAFIFIAGAGMINGGIGISDSWLEHTPFTSWTLPGVALIFIVGIPQLAALMAMILRWPEERALGMTAGIVLMAWIAVEIAWMQHFNAWQPLLFIVGAAEFVLSRRSFEPQPIHHAHMR